VSLEAIPTLTDLVEDPTRISAVPVEAVPGLRGKLAELDSHLLTRLLSSQRGNSAAQSQGDRLLNVEEAARKLGKSKDFMYRHAGDYDFVVREGRSVRFSDAGIEKYIRQRMGR